MRRRHPRQLPMRFDGDAPEVSLPTQTAQELVKALSGQGSSSVSVKNGQVVLAFDLQRVRTLAEKDPLHGVGHVGNGV